MRRRGKGEGSNPVKRTDGRYQCTYVGSDGKRHWVYGKDRKEARAKRDAALRDIAHGAYVTGPSQTTGTFLVAWMQRESGRLRPRTVQRYAGLIKTHAAPLAKVPIRKLTPQHLADLYGALRGSQSPSSIGQLHAVLHSALRQAVEWGMIARNPASVVRPPKPVRREMQVLSPAEVRHLLTACKGDPLEALYVLAVYTGLRLGELLALRWKDVNLETGWIDVNATLTRLDGTWQRTEPKTSGSRRSVKVAPYALGVLRSHRVRMAEELLPLRRRTEGDVLLFLSNGSPINGFHVTERAFKPLLRRAGLPEIRFHDLRHGFASLMLSEGVRVDLVSQMLGHASPAITLSVYAHIMPGDQEEAVRRLDAVLGGVG